MRTVHFLSRRKIILFILWLTGCHRFVQFTPTCLEAKDAFQLLLVTQFESQISTLEYHVRKGFQESTSSCFLVRGYT